FLHVLLFFLLVMYASGAPRDLHSFPTRRSSDLVPRRDVEQRAGRHRVGDADGVEAVRRHLSKVSLDGREVVILGAARPSSETLLDRKSTRLNSSHGSISYAVFCLKKKNHNTI